MLSDSQLLPMWGPRCSGKSATVSLHGQGKVTVTPAIIDAVRALNDVLVKWDYRTRAFDTGAYACRLKVSGSSWSPHSYKIALDINWTTNPYGKRLVTDMPMGMVNDILALETNSRQQLWQWGGAWRGNKDAMHYQIATTPAHVATGVRFRPPGPSPAPAVPVVPVPVPLTVPEGDDDMAILIRAADANPTDPFKAGDIFRVTGSTYVHCNADDVTVQGELAPITGDDPRVHNVNAPKVRSIMRTRIRVPRAT